ncbi:MAG: ribosome small subunit-dependent GTPase A, partial [Candidatus Obscuribacterales bacterium]|nr:ribosome small subunit-dependent GTPase A [Candidatus Obscuribacterales bacterium]
MVVGTVLRSHAGGYLVYLSEKDLTLQCQARGRLKKERVSILTGDRVELEDLNFEHETGIITRCLSRWSLLTRPLIANVDQVAIVQAVRQPEWNQLWCDRYIVHFQLELPDSMPILCFNKCDLVDSEYAQTLCRVYESLGYRVVLVSAKTQMGLNELSCVLENKITVFAGASGVGKSSLLNALEPSLNLKIGVMDNEFGVGRHTTTYSEIYRVKEIGAEKRDADGESYGPTWVADTPGFNLAELRHPEPVDVMWQFPEIIALAKECRFSDCLHLVEIGCNVTGNLVDLEACRVYDGSQVPPPLVSRERYENYVTIVSEAQAEQSLQKDISKKMESSVKRIGGQKGKGKAIT